MTAQKTTITGRYTDLIFRPHHLAEIRLDGLYVGIQSSSERAQSKTAEVDSRNQRQFPEPGFGWPNFPDCISRYQAHAQECREPMI